jgi:hypothetical protein
LLELSPVDVVSELGFLWSATRYGEPGPDSPIWRIGYVVCTACSHQAPASLVVEGDEAKLPEVRKSLVRNTSAFILGFTSSGLGSGDSKLHHDMWITTPVTLKGCVRSHLHCALAVWCFAHSLESAGLRDLAVDSTARNFNIH